MKTLSALLVATILFGIPAFAHDHPPHNMVLFGSNEIFASHIVYKEPHNYQVILQLDLDQQAKQVYLNSVAQHPNNQHIFLLDSMDIKEIAKQRAISGKLLIEDNSGKRQVILQRVVIQRDHFKIIFFDELPLSLENKQPFMGLAPTTSDSCACSRKPVLKCDAGETAYLCKCQSGRTYAECR